MDEINGTEPHFFAIDEVTTVSPLKLFLGKEAYDQLMKELDLPPLKSPQLEILFAMYPPEGENK
jgi:hypothetical protein